MPWGYHMIINATKCNAWSIRKSKNIAMFTQDLVKRIDMVPFGKPNIVKFGTGDKAGYTLVQLIETSNICAHFCEETNDAYFDVFSCKAFDHRIVNETVNEYFDPKYMESFMIYRDAGSVKDKTTDTWLLKTQMK